MLDVDMNIPGMTHQLLRSTGSQDGSLHHACIRSQPVESALSRVSVCAARQAHHAHDVVQACMPARARLHRPWDGHAPTGPDAACARWTRAPTRRRR